MRVKSKMYMVGHEAAGRSRTASFGIRSGRFEVVVRLRSRLALDVLNSYLVGHVSAAGNPVTPAPAPLVRFHPSHSTLEAPRSQPPKGVGFPDPLSGTLNGADRLIRTPPRSARYPHLPSPPADHDRRR